MIDELAKLIDVAGLQITFSIWCRSGIIGKQLAKAIDMAYEAGRRMEKLIDV